MKRGTCYFVSRLAAIKYYRAQEQCDADAILAVDEKLAAGEIHLGPPTIKPGERLVLVDNQTRYAIIEVKA